MGNAVDASSLLPAGRFDKGERRRDTSRMGMLARARQDSVPPLLLAGFAAFVMTLAYLVAMSLRRREAPVFAPSAAARVRATGWTRGGDTLTVDASREDAWAYVSLAQGRVLAASDTAGWDVTVRRYRVRGAGVVTDLGAVPFERATVGASPSSPSGVPGEIGRWYTYSFVSHLLASNGHVYAVRGHDGRSWRVQVVSYYCPGVRAGCLTLRYAPDGD